MSDISPKPELIQKQRVQILKHEKYYAAIKALTVFEYLRIQRYPISYDLKSDTPKEIIKVLKKFNSDLALEKEYQDKVLERSFDKIDVLSKFGLLMPDIKKGDYFLMLENENPTQFKLCYVTQENGKIVGKVVDGVIDPPNYKLEDSALKKTWFKSDDLQTCIDACLAKKLGTTTTPALDSKMEKNSHPRTDGSTLPSKTPKFP
jgi:hypothetical protein